MSKSQRGEASGQIDNHIGARIRERRLMLGLTQQQFAEMIGVTYQQALVRVRHQPRFGGSALRDRARAGCADHLFL